MNTAVTFDHVSKTYGRGSKAQKALNDISFEVPAGSFFGVIGSSGAGKSTLIRTVNGLETPTSGSVDALGRNPATLNKPELAKLRREIGMIFQHYNLLQSKTIAQNVALPLVLAGESKDTIDRQVRHTLELVGLADRADAYPSQLSGGQCQRVGIARALVTNPKVLLSDEATSALDPITTRQILDLLNDINRQYGITVLLITHQMSVIARACEHVVVLAHGDIVERGKVSDVFAHPKDPLTRQFVETVVPRQLPKNLTDRISSGGEGSVVRVWYRSDAAKHILADINAAVHPTDITLLHANENALRDVTLGQLIIGLDGVDGSSLAERLAPLENDQREFEVLHV
ncbi:MULTISPECIES: methionine ABC transporter ATP-binding protein [Bifidobacterium]|uniref:methionine ABC transporter ATP-binding protein n=1 Tax=Bifidobacterium TaxID=1678 RepID=UPI001BDC3671|nr:MULTISPECIES: ATP-binding cassette domain-containing protein [Bifidobacterium]MBT1161131.1 ATP-binding cassette domain-containing protein [Bifidobacterium sp. SO1]MBW3078205.1 ATP-binding cassette domain-containing protein [Bifidobacterium simiiventris]